MPFHKGFGCRTILGAAVVAAMTTACGSLPHARREVPVAVPTLAPTLSTVPPTPQDTTAQPGFSRLLFHYRSQQDTAMAHAQASTPGAGYVEYRTAKVSKEGAARDCWSDLNCMSFTYNENNGTAQMHRVGARCARSVKARVVVRAGFSFHDIADVWKSKIASTDNDAPPLLSSATLPQRQRSGEACNKPLPVPLTPRTHPLL